MISRMPCTVDSSWSGCSSATLGARASWSLTLGLYFMVQVPWPTSMLRSTPRFSCDRRSVVAQHVELGHLRQGRRRRRGGRRRAARRPGRRPAPRCPARPRAAGRRARPGALSSKMTGSSQRAWWKRRGIGLGPIGSARRCCRRRGASGDVGALIGAPPRSVVGQPVDVGLRVHLGDADERRLAQRREARAERSLPPKMPALEQRPR